MEGWAAGSGRCVKRQGGRSVASGNDKAFLNRKSLSAVLRSRQGPSLRSMPARIRATIIDDNGRQLDDNGQHRGSLMDMGKYQQPGFHSAIALLALDSESLR